MKYTDSQLIKMAGEALVTEAKSISGLVKLLDKNFPEAVRSIANSKGRVVVSGIGKSAIIANKLVATFNSTGTPALFLHAADAIHGDLGMIQPGDVMICISKSGESPEIKVLIPVLKQTGNKLIAITGNMKSYLATNSNLVLNTTVAKEACPNNLAPTSSTTAQLAMCDALAVCLLNMKGFTAADFAKVHPGGALGKKLYLRVDDFAAQHSKPVVHENDSIEKVILTMTQGRLGATAVEDKNKKLCGIITDGDLRRMLQKKNQQAIVAKNIMNPNPKTIEAGTLAVDALDMLRQKNISQIIITNRGKYCGMLHIHDLLKEGLL